MPELFVSNNVAQIRWIPSFYDENVLNLCKHYYNDCPDDLIKFNNLKLSKENQIIIFISLVMNGLIKHCFKRNEFKPHSRTVSKTAVKLLTGNLLIIKSSKQNSVIKNISKKFSVFYLNELQKKKETCEQDIEKIIEERIENGERQENTEFTDDVPYNVSSSILEFYGYDI